MKKFSYMLAPMEDMTGNAFRNICHKYGADLTFTEMARLESLAKNNKSTWSRTILKDATPTEIQVIGAKEPKLHKFLSLFTPEKGFKGFNLNFGCPDPKVISLGLGCAMIRRIAKTQKMINIFKDYGYPISIKMRLGLNKRDKENKVYLNLINEVDADYFIIHARYGTQKYSEPADISIYEECVKSGKIIIANGDIDSKEKIENLKTLGVKGVMIGRGAILDTTIFNKLKGIPSPSLEEVKKEFLTLHAKYKEAPKYETNFIKRIGIKKF